MRDPFDSLFGSMRPGAWSLSSRDGCEVVEIGRSREGRALYGIACGDGELRASIVGGAHADEPVGPRTAVRFAEMIARGDDERARALRARWRFKIVPHANPDGDARNAAWQGHFGKLASYLLDSVRELPGDDVEFGYPRAEGDRGARPENLAVADFLRAAGGPFAFHASLHGMGFAEGAWYLVSREWADRARDRGVFERLARASKREGLSLHDVERRGEKDFHRLAPGFCTTPRSDAMRDHFLGLGDTATAALFRPSSMEFVASLGGDPLCMVSELPLYVLRQAAFDVSPLDARPSARLRDRLAGIRAALVRGDDGPLRDAVVEFGIEAVPRAVQERLQLEVLFAGLELAGSRA